MTNFFSIKNILVLFFSLGICGCIVSNKPNAYYYNSGDPSYEIRESEWEGFGDPADSIKSTKSFIDLEGLKDNPKVLWIIADTYGNSSEMDKEWFNRVPWFFNENRLRFVEPDNSPSTAQHWHGFGCYSRGWPLLYRFPNVDYVLFRMIDVPNGENLLLDFVEDELEKYKGRVVLSNSWGVPRQYNSWDSILEHDWKPWVERVHGMEAKYPDFTVVFSSGNSGPDFSGYPQSMLTNAVLVGASDKYGKIASFSSQDHRMFCVAGGHNTFVADPKRAGEYDIVSGTSFSCPTVASMIVKLLAENPDWNRIEVLSFLKSQIVPSPDAIGFNPVWGLGELEQFNQSVNENVWRELGFPKGFFAKVRSLLTPSKMVDLPKPIGD